MISYVGRVYTLFTPGKERITDKSVSRYWSARSVPETPWDIKFVRKDTSIKMFLYNGENTPMQLTDITYVDANAIEVTDPPAISLPVNILPKTGIWVEVTIFLNGPSVIEAYITFETDKGNSVFHVYGIRAPYLDGVTVNLHHKHNWKNGYIEELKWSTDTLITYDGTEQRIGALPLPRRSYNLEFIEEGNDSSLLETFLSARATDYYNIPTWHDLGVTTKSEISGSTELYVDTVYRDYTEDQKVGIWNSNGEFEIYTILYVFNDHLVLLDAITSDLKEETLIVPVRPYFNISGFTEQKITDAVSLFTCRMESVYDVDFASLISPEVYNGYEIFPSKLNFITSSDTTINNWQILDNKIGMPEIVKQSLDPIKILNVEVFETTRELCGIFLSFLHTIRGKAVPYYLLSNVTSLFPVTNWLSGDSILNIKFANYTDDIIGEQGKTHIQIDYTDGTNSRHKIIGSSFNPIIPEEEELIVSPVFDTDRLISEVASIKYLQLVRNDTDIFTIKWENTSVLRCSFPVKIIQ